MYKRFGKRVIDVGLATIALLIFALPALVVMLAIKLNSRRDPVMFSHTRCGRHNRPFTMYKFRTFTVESSDYTPTKDVNNASDITSVGRILRKLSLDEIPQLYNVLRGDMSIVGPRPVLFKERKLIDLRTKNGANNVRPGITGWAQVNGRDELSPGEKAEMDGYYADKVSFGFDVKCIMLTIWAVLSLAGHAEGYEEGKPHVEGIEFRQAGE